ncbi:hypothetical protein GOPIP_029_00020 [Gordonia polyisoprenivorans NBRC 16320 = JCM 10675]|nr:hypothetical protein GOPIP_029_00020 [Gordonia polyisoprenivorans NBRC 16320 = JCM 10675]
MQRVHRRNSLSASSEACYTVGTEALAVTVAELESSWTTELIATTAFRCTECGTKVHPTALGSTKLSPSFRAGKDPGHSGDCSRRPREVDAVDDHGGPGTAVVPTELVLLGHVDDEHSQGQRPAGTVVSQRPGPGGRRRQAGSGGTDPDGRRRAHTLERIVNHWLALGSKEVRARHPLSIPGVDQSNYLYCFKQIAPWEAKIARSAPRVFYAPLRWRVDPVEDGDVLTLTLHAARRGNAAIECTMKVDRRGWSAAQRVRLDREVSFAVRRARELWFDSKAKHTEQQSGGVTMFAVAEQDSADTTMFTIRDPRVVHFTDRPITQ